MKIFSTKQLQEADLETIKKQGITSTELMERAGTLVFEEIQKRLQNNKITFKIFCGIGNNGGDGLVVARHLIEDGYKVLVYIINYSDKRSKDFLINYDRFKNVTNDWPLLLKDRDDFPELNENDFVIDAVFGIGLNRPLVTWVANLLKHINKSNAYILSIDMPSGMAPDSAVESLGAVIKADVTFTFQAPKMAFFLPQTATFAGNVKVLDIGLDREYLQKTATTTNLIHKKYARKYYQKRKKFSHKGTYGHALLIGGSYGKIGSVCLTATATLHSGAGMATVFLPKCGYNIVQTILPEAMAITDKSENDITEVKYDFEPAAICFGVGVGRKPITLKAFEELLNKIEKPMVIDADGLNLLSEKPELLEKLPKNSILTPHPKELERLVGSWKGDFQKLEKAKIFAEKYRLILVIKGAHTITIGGKDIYINNTGNPGMATAGSGDVLAGIITGLIAQGYDPVEAAVFGVYLHGEAGDIAAEKIGYESLIANDICNNLGAAYLELQDNTP